MNENSVKFKYVIFPDSSSGKVLLDDGTWVEPSTGGSVNINVDGGAASTVYFSDQVLDCGGANG